MKVSNNILIKRLAVLLMSCVTLVTYAQTPQITGIGTVSDGASADILSNPCTSGGGCNLDLNKSDHFPAHTGKTFKKAELIIRLSSDNIHLNSTASQSASITVNVSSTYTGFTAPAAQTMVVNDNSPVAQYILPVSLTEIDDMDDFIIQVTVNSTTNLTSGDVEFSYEYVIEYELQANLSGLTFVPTQAQTTNTRKVNFNWKWKDGNGDLVYFPYYQFQLTRVYNQNISINDPKMEGVVDWNNALTIDISDDLWNGTTSLDNFSLTLAEGTGMYVWRVRPIGNASGGFANVENLDGNWSATPATYNFIDITNSGISNPANTTLYRQGYFYFKDPDEKASGGKNWIYSRTFTEENKVAETMVYANSLLQTKQTQVYLPSQDKTWVNQTIYDYSGRPALNTLPTPSPSSTPGLNGYVNQLVRPASATEVYRNKHFDIDDHATLTDGDQHKPYTVTQNFGYYQNNPDVPIGNANGYPFSRTIYKDDGTERPIEQSGPGEIHSIAGTHTVKYWYGTATDEELIRVLGTAAPAGNMVFKEIITDQNGVKSVVFKDYDGKVIATCLSLNSGGRLASSDPGDPDDPTDPMNLAYTISASLSDKMATPGAEMVSYKRIVLSEAVPVSFVYEVECPTSDAAVECNSPELKPKYYLRYYIHDVNNKANSIYAEQVEIDCETYSDPIDEFTFKKLADNTTICTACNSVSLQPGEYIIEKFLVANDAANQQAVDNFTANNEAVKQVIEYMEAELSTVTDKQSYRNFIYKYSQDKYFWYIDDINNIAARNCACTGFTYSVVGSNYILYPSSTCTAPCTAPAAHKNDVHVYITSPCTSGNCFDLGTDNDFKPYTLHFETKCCTLTVELDYTPDYCDQFEDAPPAAPTAAGEGFKFITLAEDLFDEMECTTCDIDEFFENSLFENGSTAYTADFEKMIYHMLSDEYYDNPANSANSAVQYNCDALASCWMNAVHSYIATKKEINETEDGKVVMSNDPTDNDDDENTNWDVEEMANDAYDQLGVMGKLLKLFGKKKRKEAIDQIKNALNGGGPASTAKYVQDVDYVDQFFQCAKYKFAAVIEQGTTSGCGSAFVSGSGNYSIASNGQINDPDAKAVYDANVNQFDRIYAFKYFRYNRSGTTVSSANAPFVYNAQLETAYCYCGDYTACDEYMNEVTCTSGSSNILWSFAIREAFYNSLVEDSQFELDAPTVVTNTNTSLYCSDIDPDCCDPGSSNDPDWGWKNIAQQVKAKSDACKSGCEGKRGTIKNMLIKEFEASCYTIVYDICAVQGSGGSGASNANLVHINHINKITDALVKHCRDLCNLNMAYAYDNSVCSPTNYVELKVGSPQENKFWETATNKDVQVNIPDICPGATTTLSSNDDNDTWNTSSTTNFRVCGIDYSTSNYSAQELKDANNNVIYTLYYVNCNSNPTLTSSYCDMIDTDGFNVQITTDGQ